MQFEKCPENAVEQTFIIILDMKYDIDFLKWKAGLICIAVCYFFISGLKLIHVCLQTKFKFKCSAEYQNTLPD